jgi:hypothetical protein
LKNLFAQTKREQLYEELRPGTFPKGFEQAWVTILPLKCVQAEMIQKICKDRSSSLSKSKSSRTQRCSKIAWLDFLLKTPFEMARNSRSRLHECTRSNSWLRESAAVYPRHGYLWISDRRSPWRPSPARAWYSQIVSLLKRFASVSSTFLCGISRDFVVLIRWLARNTQLFDIQWIRKDSQRGAQTRYLMLAVRIEH